MKNKKPKRVYMTERGVRGQLLEHVQIPNLSIELLSKLISNANKKSVLIKIIVNNF